MRGEPNILDVCLRLVAHRQVFKGERSLPTRSSPAIAVLKCLCIDERAIQDIVISTFPLVQDGYRQDVKEDLYSRVSKEEARFDLPR